MKITFSMSMDLRIPKYYVEVGEDKIKLFQLRLVVAGRYWIKDKKIMGKYSFSIEWEFFLPFQLQSAFFQQFFVSFYFCGSTNSEFYDYRYHFNAFWCLRWLIISRSEIQGIEIFIRQLKNLFEMSIAGKCGDYKFSFHSVINHLK